VSWRIARSLDTLRAEYRARHGNVRVDVIGDAAHAARWSDHNPLKPPAPPVVCAADFFPQAAAQHLAGWLVRSRDPRIKYLIHNRQILFGAGGPAPWTWRSYTGSNPHITHVHVSVGRGPDGRSTHASLYDDPAPWGYAPPLEEAMFCKHGDRNSEPVRLLQHRLKYIHGRNLGTWGPAKDGVDGSYGDDTARQLAAVIGGNGRTFAGVEAGKLAVADLQKAGTGGLTQSQADARYLRPGVLSVTAVR
jgi:hypothetical protein